MNLGDKVESALNMLGIDKELAERWLGPECGCEERKIKLNLIGQWASRTLAGTLKDAKAKFLQVVSDS
jgi:hypothetical protein